MVSGQIFIGSANIGANIFVLAALAPVVLTAVSMNKTHQQFQEVFNELYTLSISDKMKFLDDLLFFFTIAGRSIWSDGQHTDAGKVEAFRWLNELLHRIWNIRSELRHGEEKDFVTRLHETMKFYGEQSDLLNKHLVPTILGAFEIFIQRKQGPGSM